MPRLLAVLRVDSLAGEALLLRTEVPLLRVVVPVVVPLLRVVLPLLRVVVPVVVPLLRVVLPLLRVVVPVVVPLVRVDESRLVSVVREALPSVSLVRVVEVPVLARVGVVPVVVLVVETLPDEARDEFSFPVLRLVETFEEPVLRLVETEEPVLRGLSLTWG